jgi:hypothetical protein
MRTHLNVLAWLHLALAGVWLFSAARLLLATAGVATFLGMSGREPVGTGLLAGGFGVILAIGFAASGLVELALAYGLWNGLRWARALGVLAGALDLLAFPLGTCLGVYTLWAMARWQADATPG